ncbi:MAG TPA: hypothetical protein VGM41_00370, partial [Chitinophagaceae bacterium]
MKCLLFFFIACTISQQGFCQQLPAYPYENKVTEILKAPPPAGWKKSGTTKLQYLRLMERIVRTAAPWVDSAGAVIDPYGKAEWGQTTPRFVSSAAI